MIVSELVQEIALKHCTFIPSTHIKIQLFPFHHYDLTPTFLFLEYIMNTNI